MPPGASGESQCTCARGPTSGVLPRSGILSAAPKHGILVPIADAFARILPCGAAWARTPHDTCSPTWSGIGSDKDPTLDPPSLVIKPREEDLTPGTVKPVQVSLVEPVAYQFQLTAATAVLFKSFDETNGKANDPLAGTSSRPDFVGIIYPGPSPFAPNRTPPPIPRNVPPAFVATGGSGDQVHAIWAMEYFGAMLAMGVPNIEIHIY